MWVCKTIYLYIRLELIVDSFVGVCGRRKTFDYPSLLAYIRYTYTPALCGGDNPVGYTPDILEIQVSH